MGFLTVLQIAVDHIAKHRREQAAWNAECNRKAELWLKLSRVGIAAIVIVIGTFIFGATRALRFLHTDIGRSIASDGIFITGWSIMILGLGWYYACSLVADRHYHRRQKVTFF